MKAAVELAKVPDPICPTETLGERERLILEHLRQVRLIARRIHDRVPENVCLDDLVSAGIVGLIAAIDRFDRSRNVTLKTYAEHKIKGAILDSLRQLDWAPRQDRKHAKQIDAAINTAQQRLQRPPTEEEVAATLNLTVVGYRQWQVKVRGLNLGQLESGSFGDCEGHDLLLCLSADHGEWPLALLERSELQLTLATAIAGIPPIEKTVLNLYYHQELTLREIAKIVCLHESRISQIKAQAILRLRVCMGKLWPGSH